MIPLARPSFGSEELKEVREVLKSGWVAGGGPESHELSSKIAKYTGARYAIALNNCTSALHLSLLSLGIKEGDEVLVADYTFPATALAVLYCGAKPIFVDIDRETYNMNPADLKKKISRRSKAIIPVHLFGQSADMKPITEISSKHNLEVIEDAACSFGAKYKSKMVGTIGNTGCFSFHARKNITMGEGGAVVTNNKNIAEKIDLLSNFGISSAYKRSKGSFFMPKFSEAGFNYKLSDINAAVGIVQIKKNKRFIRERRNLAEYYNEKLRDLDLIKPPIEAKDCYHVYQSYVVLVDKRVDTGRLINSLRESGVGCNIGSYSCHRQPLFKSKVKCPVSKELSMRTVALPMYNGLSLKQIDFIISKLEKTLKNW